MKNNFNLIRGMRKTNLNWVSYDSLRKYKKMCVFFI